jgi:molybdenum cofactor guanylyltransferase
MGANKALLEFVGRPLISHVIRAASSVFEHVVISARDADPYRRFGLPIVLDELTVPSPLAGIHAVLTKAKTERVFVVAADLPLVLPEVLRLIATTHPEADMAVPKLNEFFEPLLACYSRKCVPFIESHFALGDRKVASFFGDEGLNMETIGETELRAVDPELDSLFNVNTRANLQKAEQIALSHLSQADNIERRS